MPQSARLHHGKPIKGLQRPSCHKHLLHNCWITASLGFLSTADLYALQGFNEAWVQVKGFDVPESVRRKAAGNAMTLPVLASVMEAALFSLDM